MGASQAELESLYRDRYLSFRRALANVTGSYEVAHDVTQEAFARALSQSRRYRGDAPLGAWVWGIALRVAREERMRRHHLPLEDAFEGRLVDPGHDEGLANALRALPPRRRLVFFLRYFADMSYREIAIVCGISEGTVAATVAQARSALVEALAETQPVAEEVAT